MNTKSRFKNVAVAGITFQAGSAAVDSATIMSALVYQLTGNPILVGAVTAILRFGWLFPQLFVGYLAQHRSNSMRYYIFGAFGRATSLMILAAVLFIGADWPAQFLAIFVLLIWTAYAFISGIVAVPYNDIVARSVPSERRSRLLAVRFFGGGVLALGVVSVANRLFGRLEFPLSFAAIIAMASILMFISSVVFIAMGEPKTTTGKLQKSSFVQYLKKGAMVFRKNSNFRKFVYAQWCGGAVLMAMPFYVVQANAVGIGYEKVAVLLGAQTVGALVSNTLWGWWGDRLGKASLLKCVVAVRILPPLVILLFAFGDVPVEGQSFFLFVATFFVLGALANGLTIAVIGYLMEISPDKMRPAYSGYFNAITAPAFLLPLLAGFIAALLGLVVVFVISMVAAILQFYFVARIDSKNEAGDILQRHSGP